MGQRKFDRLQQDSWGCYFEVARRQRFDLISWPRTRRTLSVGYQQGDVSNAFLVISRYGGELFVQLRYWKIAKAPSAQVFVTITRRESHRLLTCPSRDACFTRWRGSKVGSFLRGKGDFA